MIESFFPISVYTCAIRSSMSILYMDGVLIVDSFITVSSREKGMSATSLILTGFSAAAVVNGEC